VNGKTTVIAVLGIVEVEFFACISQKNLSKATNRRRTITAWVEVTLTVICGWPISATASARATYANEVRRAERPWNLGGQRDEWQARRRTVDVQFVGEVSEG